MKNQPRLLYVDHMEGEGLAMFPGALALGLEGIVANPYVEGPQEISHWLEIKNKNYERKEKVEFSQKRR